MCHLFPSYIKNILLFFLLTGILQNIRCSRPQRIVIENKLLRLEADERFPVIYSFLYKPGDVIVPGDSIGKGWNINGKLFSWDQWKIAAHQMDSSLSYRMSLPALQISFDYTLTLTADGVHLSLSGIDDPHRQLHTISWAGAPLVICRDSTFRWWTRKTHLSTPWEEKKVLNRGLWSNPQQSGKAGDDISQDETMDACIWWKDKVAVGLVNNTELFPVRLEGDSTNGVSLGLNLYRHILQGQVMGDLQADLLFLPDLNSDGLADERDYFLWRNRHLDDVNAFLRSALAYKVFMDVPPLASPATTLSQLQKIVTTVHHITDGLPQIVYMVGWQYDGHDTGYPSLDKWNDRIGPHEEVYELARYFRDSLNTCLSYHINIDDAYKNSKDFSPAIMATDYDGGPMYWQMGVTDSCFHISHYKDVQTGDIFKRLDRLFQTVPVEKVLHIDAMRTINCNPAWEKDSLGLAAELELGLKPILHFLKEKGVDVTTEGQNSMPHELMGLVAGFWHLEGPSVANLMIYHRKLIGGGWQDGRGRLECGLGTSIHADIAYAGANNTVSFVRDWKMIKERIYLGSLLYQYYLERHLINVTQREDSTFLQFDDSTITTIDRKHDQLLVKQKDIVIALNDDRFIPRDSCIYAFSKTGSDREWILPASFRGKHLKVFTLTEQGRGAAPDYRINGNTIHLKLAADVPVKIALQ